MNIDAEVDAHTQRSLFERVRRHTGIHMAPTKWPLLHGRLRRRLRALGLDDYREYLAVLEHKPEEQACFIDLVTTNETAFFRTQRVWDYLQREFLPTWHREHPATVLQAWSAAASSGEEAYSLAMSCDLFRDDHPAFRYRIVGTDISRGVLEQARAGRYRGRSIHVLRSSQPQVFQRFFRQDGEEAVIQPALATTVSFREHHLHQPLQRLPAAHLVLLRNVLIYFDAAGQRQVLQQVARAMQPGGVLVVGESESITQLDGNFVFEQPLIYRRGGQAA